MAIQLYKPGNTHKVKGVECEVKNFDIAELDYQLKEGWYRYPGEWDQGEAPAEEQSGYEDEAPQEYSKTDPNHPVRVSAREAGIDGWDTKRLATLEKLLNGTEE